ncbi:hypothetical protein NU10_12320 [Flavobacterium dauae]|uniref:hypothetical protein n=1 Tax=Flavobacterium dauae TaxID=1563479 RepID=UPI00101B2815|nr:hypothetical protein [Flavobacterium dauae]WLD23482.1 hypothetical protein NU10_12320 [Flavobacterium dauae]
MKINKLLFFLLAVFSLNSCVEYVDNGTEPDGPEKPEEQVFVAKLSEESEGEFVGDEFIFEATLNGVDVTSATTFKVNGVAAKGNVFKAIKEGENAVLATMDDFTSTFRFTVKEKEEEPEEPTGNRIDFKGNSTPLTTTYFFLNAQTDADGNITGLPDIQMSDGVTDALNWQLINFDGTDLDTAKNVYMVEILMPLPSDNSIYPFQAKQIEVIGGGVVLNGAAPFTVTNMDINFAQTGNTTGANANTNYTSTATGANSGDLAELFWDGKYSVGADVWKPMKSKGVDSIKRINISKDQIKNLKIKRLNNEQIKKLKNNNL